MATAVLAQWPGMWKSPLGTTLLLAAWFLPLAVYSELTAAALRALQRVALAIAGEAISRPVLALLFLVALHAFLDDAVNSAVAFATYMLATVFSASLVSFWLARFAPPAHRVAVKVVELKHWLVVSAPLMIASAVQSLLYSVDVIMLGAMATPADSGVYNAAGKLSMIALFAMNAIQLAVGPLISTAIAKNDSARLRGVIRTATMTSLAITLPIVAALILFRKNLLAMFGTEFESGGVALAILALAQLFNTATGPVGLILSLTGQQHRLVACLGFGLLVNVALNVVWIPAYGLIGAASAAALAHVCWNLAAVVAVVKHVGVNPTVFPFWRASGRHASRGKGP
jgi:O-antigen/teichoic acid export membrane protein